ncbi:MAG TPA: biopolymer transporter ExbD, partial [Gemmataceae bacterium]|nr:biopolymer transporter ExbD [Gemmataceae bacterium]
MSWSVRHQGSPNVTSNLTAQQVLEGLREGIWEPTDEVRADNEMKWQALEEHPFFAEPVSDLEQPPKYVDTETHLDMNPLIDVALVLLIFFILTTTYEALRQVMDMPQMSKTGQLKVISESDAKNEYIRVKARMEGEKTVYTVDDQQVSEEQLPSAIGIGVANKRNKMIIDAEGVTWESVCKIIGAGKQKQVQKFLMR